jgi:integrase
MGVRVEPDPHRACKPGACVLALKTKRCRPGGRGHTDCTPSECRHPARAKCHPRDLWWVRVDWQKRRKSISFSSKKAAQQAAVKIDAALKLGYVHVLDGKSVPVPTFADVAKEWLDRYPALHSLRDATRELRTGFVNNHLIPFFGPRRISDITPELVEDFIAAKRRAGGSVRGQGNRALADATLKTNLPCLRMIFDHAVRRKWLAANPMRGVPLWRSTPRLEEPDPFTQVELTAIIEAAEAISPPFALMLRVWVQSGMRSGELRGLRRASLDPSAGLVKIEHSLDRHGQRGPTKTLRSLRTASLLYPVCESVADWAPGATAESRSVLLRLAQVVPLDETAPLFPSLDDATQPMSTDKLRHLWTRVLMRARVRHRKPYNLRHTHISLMLSRNAPLLMVAAQVGDRPETILKYYARWMPGQVTAPHPGASPAQVVPAPAHKLPMVSRTYTSSATLKPDTARMW